MSEIYKTFSKNTTDIGGVKRISGIDFLNNCGEWSATHGPIKYTLDYTGPHKCTVTDTRDGYLVGFNTVAGAKAFARRRRHGRTIKEHFKAESLQIARESLGLSINGLAGIINVSPRTVESYFSGARAVPDRVLKLISL